MHANRWARLLAYRLNVAMNEAFFVGGFQSGGNLARDGDGFFERQRTLEIGALH